MGGRSRIVFAHYFNDFGNSSIIIIRKKGAHAPYLRFSTHIRENLQIHCDNSHRWCLIGAATLRIARAIHRRRVEWKQNEGIQPAREFARLLSSPTGRACEWVRK